MPTGKGWGIAGDESQQRTTGVVDRALKGALEQTQLLSGAREKRRAERGQTDGVGHQDEPAGCDLESF